MIDEMNDGRARKGLRQRYKPVIRDGLLTMEFYDLRNEQSNTTPSPLFNNNEVRE